MKGPCEDLFRAIEKALGENLPIFAEDLGIITPEVEHLRDSLGFPGMKVLQFGFGDLNDIDYIPHFYTNPNCICYTGTHDNDTTMAGMRLSRRSSATASAAMGIQTEIWSAWTLSVSA